MSLPIISVEKLSKAYRIGIREEGATTLAGAAVGALKSPFKNFRRLRRLNTFGEASDEADTHWALRDVSFEVAEGEVVGIIGRNGAGKSTLLKLLSRITEPTSGRAVLRGRVSSLLEVGTGFHPELTGRENVYLNGTILGMTKREVERKFDEIVEFSGIEKFLDTPIKRYSSGMTVRLAFAVAAHLESEILIIDEVLAVGDVAFQRKCMGKVQEIGKSGRSILLVSHNMASVQSLATSCLVLNKGGIAYQGDTTTGVTLYGSLNETRDHADLSEISRGEWKHLSQLAELRNFDVSPEECVPFGSPIYLKVRVHLKGDLPEFRISATIFRSDSVPVGSWFTAPLPGGTAGSDVEIILKFAEHRLAPGSYYFAVATGIGDNDSGHQDFDILSNIGHFQVSPEVSADGYLMTWAHNWGPIAFMRPSTASGNVENV
ncbi:Teichoic acids export ATP-binding protein TagH [Caulifigura coniformis]|uniref:Teichoic acids export ATP-binding protein TagH n=1 Tax=Caulifigura coniformis TaxID=2527983 RepID=A0A517SI99_9PLAN|nr:ABC transporter ATP-binding protein [Caulifigura coniformis]QDT55851.1 Teichoic acids export ATP-binding protein TagH [Caulifigura coniformis]